MTVHGSPSGPYPATEPRLARTVRAGFLAGALAAGLPISIAHGLLNRLDSVREAALLAVACAVLYGGWCALTVAVAALAARLLAAVRRGRYSRRAPPDGLAVGLALFGWIFGAVFLLHGLTYDQIPFGRPTGPWPVLGYSVVVALVVLAAATVLARLVAPGLRALADRRSIGVVLLSIALAIPIGQAAIRRALQAPPETPPTVVDTATLESSTLGGGDGGKPAPPDTGIPHVALVALDGADWQILRPLLARGELPQFARFIAEGVSGPLATIRDSNSAVIWASIYTGQRPEQHGILDFFRISFPGMADGFFPVHRTYFKELADQASRLGLARFRQISRYDLLAPPLWEITDRLGLSTGLVDGYYYSFPAPSPRTAGGYAVAYGADGFAAQLAAPGAGAGGGGRAADVPLFVQPPELFRDIRPLLNGEDFDWQAAVALHLLENRPIPRFLNFYTHEPDTVQHLFWKWHEPEKYFAVDDTEARQKGDRIAERYRAFDRFLGALRERLGPQAVIVVASDHGQSPTIFHPSYFTQHRHGPPGILLAAGGPLRRGIETTDATIYDLQPTILHLLGLAVPEDGVGSPRQDWLDPSFLAAHPLRRLPSYRGLVVSTVRPGAGPTSGLEREEIEKLRNLGYL